MMEDKWVLHPAEMPDRHDIWEIIHQAIIRRKLDGSTQWQDGYPNMETIEKDIRDQQGYVLRHEDRIIAYAALIYNDEPAYDQIEGNWLSEFPFLVIHRVAVSDQMAGKGIATLLLRKIESYAHQKQIPSIRADTNFDNYAMLKVLEKSGYQYCGKVLIRGDERLAFEKLIG